MSGVEYPPCALEIGEEGTGLKLKTKVSIKPHKLSLLARRPKCQRASCVQLHIQDVKLPAGRALKEAALLRKGSDVDLTLSWTGKR